MLESTASPAVVLACMWDVRLWTQTHTGSHMYDTQQQRAWPASLFGFIPCLLAATVALRSSVFGCLTVMVFGGQPLRATLYL